MPLSLVLCVLADARAKTISYYYRAPDERRDTCNDDAITDEPEVSAQVKRALVFLLAARHLSRGLELADIWSDKNKRKRTAATLTAGRS